MSYSSNDPTRVNSYDSKTYTRNRVQTRVVVKEKPLLKSRTQKLVEWLRPTQRPGHGIVNTFEMGKVLLCIVFPVFMLGYWRYTQKALPDDWETKFGSMQNKQFKEEKVEASTVDYFTIIDQFQERRAEALQKKKEEVVHAR